LKLLFEKQFEDKPCMPTDRHKLVHDWRSMDLHDNMSYLFWMPEGYAQIEWY